MLLLLLQQQEEAPSAIGQCKENGASLKESDEESGPYRILFRLMSPCSNAVLDALAWLHQHDSQHHHWPSAVESIPNQI
jgi:hypothetical protein